MEAIIDLAGLGITFGMWMTGLWGLVRMDRKAEKRYKYWDEQSEKSDIIMEGLREAIEELKSVREKTA